MVKSKKKTKVVLSLAEFNQDAKAGMEPELAALPSAPKAAEEWDEAGGRPVYNSRGFRERNATAFDRDDGGAGMLDDDEFLQRDWNRSGPLDDPDAAPSGPGAGPGERSWDAMRRGPLDAAADDDAAGGGADRDWTGMRRGPLDAAPSTDAPERSWDGMRRQAVDAAAAAGGPLPEKDIDFTAVRRGPVEPEFARDADVDFSSTRRGPIEAEFEGAPRAVDFSMRRGPVDAVEGPTGTGEAERDFSAVRRANNTVDGPEGSLAAPLERDFGSARKVAAVVDAELPAERTQGLERDFRDVRRGHVHSALGEHHVTVDPVDWNVRKGPLEAAVPAPGVEEGRVRDFKNMRQMNRPTVVDDVKKAGGETANGEDATIPVVEKTETDGTADSESRPREMTRGGGRGEVPTRPHGLHVSDSAVKERDWGRARRTQPLPSSDRVPLGGGAHRGMSHDSGLGQSHMHASTRALPDGAHRTSDEPGIREVTAKVDSLSVPSGTSTASEGSADDGDWTTVGPPMNSSRRAPRGGFIRGSSAPYRRGGGLRDRANVRPVPASGAEAHVGRDKRESAPGQPSALPDAAAAPATLSAVASGNGE